MKDISNSRLTFNICRTLKIYGVITILFIINSYAANVTPSIIMEAEILYPYNSSEYGILFITLINNSNDSAESASLNISSIKGLITSKSLQSLQARQTQTTSVEFLTSGISQLVLTLQYNQRCIQHSQSKVLELKNSKSNIISIFKGLIPIMIGGLLTLLGVIITAFFAEKRESSNRKFQWAKMLFSHYEQSYREFISGLSGTISASQIKEYFRRLSTSAFIPNHLRKKIEEFIVLVESDADVKKKKEERENLLDNLDKFVKKPWEP